MAKSQGQAPNVPTPSEPFDAEAASGGGANRHLSNLQSPVSINQDLLPDSGGTRDIGDLVNTWRVISLDIAGWVNIGLNEIFYADSQGVGFYDQNTNHVQQHDVQAYTSDHVVSWPDKDGMIAMISDIPGAGANVNLSNLASPTAINQHLVPSTPGVFDLGNLASPFNNLWLTDGGLVVFGLNNNFTYVDGVGPAFVDRTTGFDQLHNVQSYTGTRTVTWPDKDGTIAMLSDVPSLQIGVNSADFLSHNQIQTDVPGLSVNLISGERYRIRANVWISPDTTDGYQWGLSGTASGDFSFLEQMFNNTTNSLMESFAQILTGAVSGYGDVSGENGAPTMTDVSVIVDGILVCTASGTLTFTFAQSLAGATTSTLHKQGYLSAEKV